MLINLGSNELNRIREWFDSVQDTNTKYLESKDYDLAKRIYEALGQRVPDSIRTKCSDFEIALPEPPKEVPHG